MEIPDKIKNVSIKFDYHVSEEEYYTVSYNISTGKVMADNNISLAHFSIEDISVKTRCEIVNKIIEKIKKLTINFK